jgi:hypothetical protein
MRTVAVVRTFWASVPDAQTHWYDTARWAEWVDGLDAVLAVEGDWPRVGARVRWRSGPAGRGEVSETVTAHEPLAGQTVAVADDAITGEQTIAFAPAADGGVEVSLALAYQLRRRSPVTAVVDLLFIRRAMAVSLQHTLERFGASLEAARPPAP